MTRHLESSAAAVIVTTYDSARNHLALVRSQNFDMIILDEAHKLRNLHGAVKSPAMAQRVRQALEDYLSEAP